jgi:RNA polymerase sigma-70 factor (ECF subfamily)
LSHSAFEALFQEQFSFVWRSLRGLGVTRSDLDDVAQEVFVIAHRKLDVLNPELGARPWLYGISRRVVQNHRRKVRRRAARWAPLNDEYPSDDPGPERVVAARETASLVMRLLAGLEPERREVFWLVELEQFSVPEVAQALEIPLNTVYSRLRLARADFKSLAAREEVL